MAQGYKVVGVLSKSCRGSIRLVYYRGTITIDYIFLCYHIQIVPANDQSDCSICYKYDLNNKHVGSNKSKTINGASRETKWNVWRESSPVRRDGRSRRSIDRQSTQYTRIQVGLLRRHVALFLGYIVNSSSFVSSLLSSTSQLVVHRQESDGYSKLCGFDHTPRSRDVQKFD